MTIISCLVNRDQFEIFLKNNTAAFFSSLKRGLGGYKAEVRRFSRWRRNGGFKIPLFTVDCIANNVTDSSKAAIYESQANSWNLRDSYSIKIEWLREFSRKIYGQFGHYSIVVIPN